MNKEDKYSLGYVIGKSIQENKDKREKLEKQNIRFKKKNKQLKTQLDIANKKLEDMKEYINYLVIFDPNIGRFNKTIWGEELLSIIGGE